MAESNRKAPRWSRTLLLEADDAFRGEVLDLSAVGIRVRVKRAPAPGDKLYAATLTFENEAHVRIKVRIARMVPVGEHAELGLEIAEADKSFYDALPRLRRDSGEHVAPEH